MRLSSTLMPGGIIAMTGEAAGRLLKLDHGDAALLYLHLLKGTSVNAVNWPEPRLRAALEDLKKLGMAPKEEFVQTQPVVQDTPPDYALEDIRFALQNRETAFPALCDEVERRLGRKLSPNDLKSLYTLYDYLNLPPEVILLLLGWCCEETARKYGAGRKPSLPAIKKEGFSWARRGIDTMERAEAHIQRLTHMRSREGEVLRLLDLPMRPLVERERSYIAAWDEMGFDNEAIRMAYEKTVLKKQSMDWAYMNAILRRWHESGFHTAESIRTQDRRPHVIQAGGQQAAQPAPAEAQQSREDMERMRRLMEQMKKGE